MQSFSYGKRHNTVFGKPQMLCLLLYKASQQKDDVPFSVELYQFMAFT